MKILTIKQPWASLIISGMKDVENRSWWPRIRTGERVGIHASKRFDEDEFDSAILVATHVFGMSPFGSVSGTRERICSKIGDFENLPRGCIIGTVEFAGAKKEISSPWHFDGSVGFYLKNPVKFDVPVPAKGRLGFWNFELESEVRNGD